jgi:hypothetical protein
MCGLFIMSVRDAEPREGLQNRFSRHFKLVALIIMHQLSDLII